MSQARALEGPAATGWARLARLTVRLALGGVMVWAGASKAGDPQGFVVIVGAYDFLPEPLVVPWAAVLPWVELVAGGCLLAGVWVRGAAVAVLGLVGLFVAALGVNIARGVDMSCGCFGLEQAGHSLPAALALDVALGVGAAVVLGGGGKAS